MFASSISKGKWKFANHLRLIDKVLINSINGRYCNGKQHILVFQAPPRHGKSEYTSHYLPAWFLGTYPDKKVIHCSYHANFSRSWGRKAKALIEEFGPEVFGVNLSRDTKSSIDWAIENHDGGMITAGVGGPIVGRGADLFIIDDPIKNAEEAMSLNIREKQYAWFNSTALTRVEPGGLIIIIMTRWHKDDLVGRLIDDAEKGEGLPLVLVNLPAISEEDDMLGREPGEALWPERWSRELLLSRKRAMDSYWWNSLYQQRPSRHEKTEWPDYYFQDIICREKDWPDRFEVSAITIDPSKGSSKGDFSAIVFTGVTQGKLWIASDIKRRPPEEIVNDSIDFYRKHNPDAVGIESNSFQDLLAPMIQQEVERRNIAPLPIHLIHNSVNKEIRIRRIGPYLKQGVVRFLEGSNQLLLSQLQEFPMGDYDDGPDALEMGERLIRSLQNQPIIEQQYEQETIIET